ncbi:MAG: transglycosylase SLT domain-containing protein [Saprospiraceae bacterium]|nr:transglycosylase SLT domain-containing protein [Saprospiraceae bacterium]
MRLSIKLVALFLLCQFLNLPLHAHDNDPPKNSLEEFPLFDKETEKILLTEFTDLMDNYPKFTDEEYRQRLRAMSQFIDFRLDPMVKERIIVRTEKYRASTERLLGLAQVYFPIFEENLAKHDVPHHLKYLPIIESRLQPVARSYAGAVGLWQFIHSTGKLYGLAMNSTQDQRRDTHIASDAAARLLSQLYDMYGDWAMALAAYNCGPGRLNRAIKASGGSKDYWVVRDYLPTETQKYVPYFMAVVYVGEYHNLHELTPIDQDQDLVLTDSLMFYQGKSLYKLAKEVGLGVDTVKMLNPGYLKGYVPRSTKGNPVILPCRVVAKLRNYEETYERLLSFQQENPLRAIRRINSEEDLDWLAKAFRCTKRDLLYWNDMAEGEEILPGTAVAIRRYLAPKEVVVKKKIIFNSAPIVSLRTLSIGEETPVKTAEVLMEEAGSSASLIATLAPTEIEPVASLSAPKEEHVDNLPVASTQDHEQHAGLQRVNTNTELPDRSRNRNLRNMGLVETTVAPTETARTSSSSTTEVIPANTDQTQATSTPIEEPVETVVETKKAEKPDFPEESSSAMATLTAPKATENIKREENTEQNAVVEEKAKAEQAARATAFTAAADLATELAVSNTQEDVMPTKEEGVAVLKALSTQENEQRKIREAIAKKAKEEAEKQEQDPLTKATNLATEVIEENPNVEESPVEEKITEELAEMAQETLTTEKESKPTSEEDVNSIQKASADLNMDRSRTRNLRAAAIPTESTTPAENTNTSITPAASPVVVEKVTIDQKELDRRDRARKLRLEAEQNPDEVYVYYKIKDETNVWDLLKVYPDISIPEVLELNNMGNNTTVYPGKVLRIRVK